MKCRLIEAIGGVLVLLLVTSSQAQAKDDIDRLPWTAGPTQLTLPYNVSLEVPAGYRVLTSMTALQALATLRGEEITKETLAIVATADGSDYAWVRHAPDAPAELAREDGVDLLKDPGVAHYLQILKATFEAGNAEAKAAGKPTVEVISWQAEPTSRPPGRPNRKSRRVKRI